MTDLILVRHGETVWHAENRYAGVSDVGLTDRGAAQGEALGRWAAAHPVDAVVASTLSRARLTAQPAADALGLPLRTDARLCEVDFGEGEGLTRTEMAARFPDALEAFLAAPARQPLPSGEPGTIAIARARTALDALVNEHPDGRVLVVMHSTLLRLVLCDLLGIDPDRYRTVMPSVTNGALTTLRTDGRRWALLGFNVPV
ncbi:histidine phosphatase family protein [Mumia quercus]|uniref:histidine phosphatase family protein n=1 Tax=Mumia quercus TaxID=2976125 RepID=UPI0021CE8D8D|nr:histidine phosphatase family protein [Mumia quercus]